MLQTLTLSSSSLRKLLPTLKDIPRSQCECRVHSVEYNTFEEIWIIFLSLGDARTGGGDSVILICVQISIKGIRLAGIEAVLKKAGNAEYKSRLWGAIRNVENFGSLSI
jgi:hypothetical protein